MRRARIRRRRAIQLDMIAGIALIIVSAAMVAAMPWFFQSLGGLQ